MTKTNYSNYSMMALALSVACALFAAVTFMASSAALAEKKTKITADRNLRVSIVSIPAADLTTPDNRFACFTYKEGIGGSAPNCHPIR